MASRPSGVSARMPGGSVGSARLRLRTGVGRSLGAGEAPVGFGGGDGVRAGGGAGVAARGVDGDGAGREGAAGGGVVDGVRAASASSPSASRRASVAASVTV